MQNSIFIDLTISIYDIYKNLSGLSFRDEASIFDDFCEISSFAELCNDACCGFERNNFIDFDDILLIAEQFKNFYLIVEQYFMDVSFHVLHIYKFESYGLSFVILGVPLESLTPRYTTLE